MQTIYSMKTILNMPIIWQYSKNKELKNHYSLRNQIENKSKPFYFEICLRNIFLFYEMTHFP